MLTQWEFSTANELSICRCEPVEGERRFSVETASRMCPSFDASGTRGVLARDSRRLLLGDHWSRVTLAGSESSVIAENANIAYLASNRGFGD
jgi:hypothetical protein